MDKILSLYLVAFLVSKLGQSGGSSSEQVGLSFQTDVHHLKAVICGQSHSHCVSFHRDSTFSHHKSRPSFLSFPSPRLLLW